MPGWVVQVMVFASAIFVFCFLPLVLALYFALPWRFRNFFLLVASLIFYAWGEPVYTLLMLASIGINYLFGLALGATTVPRRRFLVVTLSVVVNLALLIYFKYANFLVENINACLAFFGEAPIAMDHVALPLGISFFTFQAMSYVIDVYRRQVPAQRNPLDLALYIALFPQLIAGPIVRYADIAAEIVKRTVTREGFAAGARLFVIGLSKKMLVANPLGGACDRIFAIPSHELTWELGWLGPVLARLQLYFDFSGYSDMAIGMGLMLGFHFLPNFRYPAAAKTMNEFWQRWHISLSTWFRDYLFRPLGGHRCSRARAYINLTIVFFLCGLWHGASWTFIMFGMYQGLFMLLERVTTANRRWFFKSPFAHLYMFFVTTTMMVFFRADTMDQAAGFFLAMFTGGSGMSDLHPIGLYLDREALVMFLVGYVGLYPFVPWLRDTLLGASPSPRRHLAVQVLTTVTLVLLFVACAMKIAAGTHNPFIYFRF